MYYMALTISNMLTQVAPSFQPYYITLRVYYICERALA